MVYKRDDIARNVQRLVRSHFYNSHIRLVRYRTINFYQTPMYIATFLTRATVAAVAVMAVAAAPVDNFEWKAPGPTDERSPW